MSKLSVHSTAPDTQIIDHHALDSKQAAIKGQIARHQYQSLAGILLDCPSSWVQKLKHRSIPTPFWYKVALFVTLTLLIALIVELLLGNPTRVTTIGVARLWVELASLLVIVQRVPSILKAMA